MVSASVASPDGGHGPALGGGTARRSFDLVPAGSVALAAATRLLVASALALRPRGEEAR